MVKERRALIHALQAEAKKHLSREFRLSSTPAQQRDKVKRMVEQAIAQGVLEQ